MRQTFDDAIVEFIERSRELLGRESTEDHPPRDTCVDHIDGSRVPSLLVLTEELIRRYAWTMGDDNPLYIDPDYGRASPAGSQIAPGPILVHVRYPGDHGAQRPGGYPVANFLSGVAWEFYDYLRPGMRFTSSKVPRELHVGRGSRSQLISHHSETSYWDNRGALVAKAYGQLIHVPVRTMGASRIMPLDRLGDGLLYERVPHVYGEEQVAELLQALEPPPRRGSAPRWFEDVEVGDALPSVVLPPYDIRDELTYQSLHHGLHADYVGEPFVRAFRPGFMRCRQHGDFARTHPWTRWPYTPWDEHEDAPLAAYRCQPLPFDYGIQRAQQPLRLLTDWAGDAAFVRRMYTSMRRPVFYGDASVITGTVIRTGVVEESDSGGRTARYGSVTVEIAGRNQRGEMHCLGHGTIYLPTRADGLPEVPVPHLEMPPYVPFDVHRSAYGD